MHPLKPTRPIRTRAHARPAYGFTLIELIVTIAIAATLMVVAVPSFIEFQRNALLSDAVSNFVAAANTAKANAMKRGMNTYLVPNVTATGWRSGWLVYTDTNWNAGYDAGTDELVLTHEAIGAEVTIATPTASSLASGYLMFNGSGYPRLTSGGFGGGTIVMSNTNRSTSIIINSAGRIRSCKTGSTDC
jgi:type IV fimbrial biogenesis protein FimT